MSGGVRKMKNASKIFFRNSFVFKKDFANTFTGNVLFLTRGVGLNILE